MSSAAYWNDHAAGVHAPRRHMSRVRAHRAPSRYFSIGDAIRTALTFAAFAALMLAVIAVKFLVWMPALMRLAN